LVSVFPASEKFDSDLELDAWMHKTDAHPCLPMDNDIAPMSTQNPWVWVGMGMGTQCKAMLNSVHNSEGALLSWNDHVQSSLGILMIFASQFDSKNLCYLQLLIEIGNY
jgi:hypothetical protein